MKRAFSQAQAWVQSQARSRSRRRGAALAYVVVILVLTSILAVGVVSLSMASTETELSSAASIQAQGLAKSAVEYARWEYCSLGGEWSGPLTLTFTGGEAATVDLVDGEFVATAVSYLGTRLESRAQARLTAPECGSTGSDIIGEDPDDYVVYTGSAGGTYALPSGSTVVGSVFGPTVNVLPSNVAISGNIISLGQVTLGTGTTVGGFICAGGNLTLAANNVVVTGDVYVVGSVTLQSATSILGSVYATGDVILKASSSYVGGDIHAGGNVLLESGVEVAGSVYAGGTVETLNSNARVRGSVHAGGTFTGRRAIVHGSLYTGWDANLIDGTNIMQNVYAKNQVIYGSGAAKIIGGTSQAGGTRNDHIPANILLSVPNPTAPVAPSGCPPPPPPPPLQVYSHNSNHVNVPQSGSMTLAPGTYGNLNIGGGSTLTLRAGGTYIFQSFGPNPTWNTTLRLDLSTGDRLTVFVTGNIGYSGRVEVSTDGVNYARVRLLDPEVAKTLAKRIYWETHANFTIGTDNGTREWIGTVLAQNNISLASGFYLAGAIATVNGIVSSNSPQTIYYSIADFAVENWHL